MKLTSLKQRKKKEQELTRVFSNPLMNARSDGGTVGISVNSNVVSEEILMEDEVSFLHYFAHMSATPNFHIKLN